MSGRVLAKKPYVSAVVHAREILAKAKSEPDANVARSVLAHARRIMRIEPIIALDLEQEEGPYRVFRWVAWGKTYAERRRRADLALHLRHTIDTASGGWLLEPHYTAALAVLDLAVAQAKARGGVQPRPVDLCASTYGDAIRGVPKPRRSPALRAPAPPAPPAPSSPLPLLLNHEQRAALLPLLEALLRQAG